MRHLDDLDNYYCLNYYDMHDDLNCIDARLIERTEKYIMVKDLDHEMILTIPVDHVSSMTAPTTLQTLYYPEKRY